MPRFLYILYKITVIYLTFYNFVSIFYFIYFSAFFFSMFILLFTIPVKVHALELVGVYFAGN